MAARKRIAAGVVEVGSGKALRRRNTEVKIGRLGRVGTLVKQPFREAMKDPVSCPDNCFLVAVQVPCETDTGRECIPILME